MKAILEADAWRKAQLRRKRLSDRPVQYTLAHRDHHHGQDDYYLVAHTKEKKLLGHISFSTYRGNTHINMLQVEPGHRRKGIGSGLLRELHHVHKNELENKGKIRYGYSTEDGAALLASKKVPFGKKKTESVFSGKMKVFLLEAVDYLQRKQRLGKVWRRAEILAGARTLAMDNKPSPNDQTWVKYGDKANKAATAAFAHEFKPSDQTRRGRLAKLLGAARSGFAAARAGKRSAYAPAAKAFNLYKKHRYEPVVQAGRRLTRGGLVFDPTTTEYRTAFSRIQVSRRVTPPLVQTAGTKKVFVSYPPRGRSEYENKQYVAAAVRNKRLKKFDILVGVKGPKIKLRGSIDRSRSIPKYATLDPQSQRVSKPEIRRVANNFTNYALGSLGHPPLAFAWKKPIGRRERKDWVKFKKTGLHSYER